MATPGTGPEARPGFWRRHQIALAFLAPAAVLLGIWIVYPTVFTIVRSLFDRSGSDFVGLGNYQDIFTEDTLVTAIRNNALWLAVVPALVTAIGLVFGVLIERIRWSVAFRLAVFMPMAISLFAAGVIWRLMDERDPERGTVNAGLGVIADAFDPPGALSGAEPSSDDVMGGPARGLSFADPVRRGDVVPLGLTAIAEDEIPGNAVEARDPEPLSGGIV